jgi:hypothetical protein
LAAILCVALTRVGLADSCRSGGPPHYEAEKDGVSYDFYGARTPLGADPTTFKSLRLPAHPLGRCEHAADEFYGADRSHVFYESKMIPGADPASFRPLADYEYGEDRKAVFYQGEKLKGADPASFRTLLWPDETPSPTPGSAYPKRPPGAKFSVYATDARHVWEQGRVMPDFDAATFALLPMGYVRDKNGVYRDDRRVPGLDPRTFDGAQQH